MPSEQHEGLVELFKARPELALTALRDWLRIPVPHWTEVETVDSDANQAQPLERRADLAHVLSDGGEPVLAVVVEVQRQVDDDKRPSTSSGRAGPSFDRLVRTDPLPVRPELVEGSPRACRRARATRGLRQAQAERSHPVFIPHAPGPAAEPELLLLSTAAHGEQRPAIVKTLLRRLDGVDQPRRNAYARLTLGLVGPAIREEVERMLRAEDFPVDSWAKEYVEIGEARGELRGAANVVLRLLARRFGAVPDDIERRVRSADADMVQRWGDRVVDAETLDDVFAED